MRAAEAMSELADSLLSEVSPHSQTSTVTLEDLELLLVEGLASSEPLSLEENSERIESSPLVSSTPPHEQDTSKHLEEWVAKLQAEVVSLRGHKVHCKQASLSLLRELLQVRGRMQLQSSELRQLWQEMQRVVQVPEKEMQVVSSPPTDQASFPRGWGHCLLDPEPAFRAPTCICFGEIQGGWQVQPAQPHTLLLTVPWGPEPEPDADPGQKAGGGPRSLGPDQEEAGAAGCRAEGLRAGDQPQARQADWVVETGRTGPGGSLQHSAEEPRGNQPEGGPRGGQDAGSTDQAWRRDEPPLSEEGGQAVQLPTEELPGSGAVAMSPQRMKALEGTRLESERSLREELEDHWQKLQELTEDRVQALWGQREQEEEGCLREQCRGLDAAVVRLTKFVRQNQMSLSHILLMEQKARVSKVGLEESQAGELASYMQENLEAIQLASKLSRQETQGAMELLQEKSQVLERSVANLAQQLKDLGEHCLALSWRLELQEQTLGLRLSEAKTEWEGLERKSLEDLALWRKEVAAHLQEVREKVDRLPQQIEGVSDKCVLHKSDADLKILAEGKAREFEVRAMRQELATLLSSVQLLKENNPGRKIAEIQGNLATFQKQMIKLETSIQANKTIQNLKFNTETKLRSEEIAALRESMLHLWSEEGPWPLTLGSRRVFMSLVRQRFFIKDVAPGEQVPMNCWGIYQAMRWLQWKAILLKRVAQQRPEAVSETGHRDTVPQPTPV
ncbi:coiled-coil domain-containing protein 154 isoform X1 [Octodon degus]|uniref:Coiled-coil domain-containing protein 154 isoform X1 n=1 Tax=Octodon degus TaxID=10160 RepID=A0A6P6E4D7_OCTDE|nr:coiled-coil domain-containing protein 154 isoform X1 [Octodon degus]